MKNLRRNLSRLLLFLLVSSGTSIAFSAQVLAANSEHESITSSIDFAENTVNKLELLQQSPLMAKDKKKPFVRGGPPEFVRYVPPTKPDPKPTPSPLPGDPGFAQVLPLQGLESNHRHPSAQDIFASILAKQQLS